MQEVQTEYSQAACVLGDLTAKKLMLEKDVKKLQDALLTQGVILTGTH